MPEDEAPGMGEVAITLSEPAKNVAVMLLNAIDTKKNRIIRQIKLLNINARMWRMKRLNMNTERQDVGE